jgi:hypothetical protein
MQPPPYLKWPDRKFERNPYFSELAPNLRGTSSRLKELAFCPIQETHIFQNLCSKIRHKGGTLYNNILL